MDLKELMVILKETDYAGVVQGSAMTDEQLEALLDRSQLISPLHGDSHNVGGDNSVLVDENTNDDPKVINADLNCNKDSGLEGSSKDCGSGSEVVNNCDKTINGLELETGDKSISQSSNVRVNVNDKDDALNNFQYDTKEVDCNLGDGV